VAIDRIMVLDRRAGAGLVVGDDLMAEEIEVDPLGGAAALRTAKSLAVEGAGGGEVVDGEGDVEWCEGQGRSPRVSVILKRTHSS